MQALAVALRAGLYTWRGEGGALMRTYVLLGVRHLWALLNSGNQLHRFLGSCRTTRQKIRTSTTGTLPSSTTAMVHLLQAMCEWIEGIYYHFKVITWRFLLTLMAVQIQWTGKELEYISGTMKHAYIHRTTMKYCSLHLPEDWRSCKPTWQLYFMLAWTQPVRLFSLAAQVCIATKYVYPSTSILIALSLSLSLSFSLSLSLSCPPLPPSLLHTAGGLATYLHADYVKSLLPSSVKYHAIADAG